MIVVSVISTDVPASKELLQQMQRTCALRSLNHREGRLDLPAGPTRTVPEDRNTETALPVDEADDPLRGNWPFLLIVRTERIFTTHALTAGNGSDTDEYRRILGVSSIWPAALYEITLARGRSRARFRDVYLRTVIVTAAVYRGLGSELRPRANPSP